MRQEIKKGSTLMSKSGNKKIVVDGVYHGKGNSSVVVYTDEDGRIGKDLDKCLLLEFNVAQTA